MKNLKYILLLQIFLISITGLYAAEQESVVIPSFSLHIKITEMKESEAPFIVSDTIIFTYKPSRERVRHVGISFENENFSQIHTLTKNENGVYFYMYKYPKKRVINYKFVEDGVWILDSKSKSTYTDRNFIQLSTFEIPEKNIKEHLSPIINGNRVTFRFKAEKQSNVYLTGDFNNWNPFLHKLKEENPGEYSITLKLPKGKFGYYFIYNGVRILDVENPFKGISRINESVSLFTIE